MINCLTLKNVCLILGMNLSSFSFHLLDLIIPLSHRFQSPLLSEIFFAHTYRLWSIHLLLGKQNGLSSFNLLQVKGRYFRPHLYLFSESFYKFRIFFSKCRCQNLSVPLIVSHMLSRVVTLICSCLIVSFLYYISHLFSSHCATVNSELMFS